MTIIGLAHKTSDRPEQTEGAKFWMADTTTTAVSPLRRRMIDDMTLRNHPPTLAYVSKRKMEGKSNREIIRCLKRYIVREIFTHLCRPNAPLTSA